MNNILVIDIGNSYIKVGLIDDNDNVLNKILFKTKLCKDSLYLKKTLLKTFEKNIFNKSIIGSVVPSKTNIFFDVIEKEYGIKPYLISHKTKISFLLKEIKREEIADDLLSLAEYCYRYNNSGCIGFSFGTAMFAIYIKDKTLIGAVIAPGIGTSYKKLVEKASLIKVDSLNKKTNKIYGVDTLSSLEAGVNILRKGFVLSFYDSIKNKSVDCILSGGESFNIDVGFKYKIDENAILLGFKYIYDLNMKI